MVFGAVKTMRFSLYVKYNVSDGSLESLTDASGKPVFYEYDWRGNLSAVKDGNGETLAEYAHTAGGKVKEIRHGNGLCTRYEYDTDEIGRAHV